MHDPLAVRVVERARHLPGDSQRLLEPQLLFAVELVAQRFAADEGQHVVEEAAFGARVDQREDVRVVEPGRDLDLGQESLAAQHRAQFGPQHLERHLAVVLEVGGQVDGGHAAGAELPLDAIALFKGGGQGGDVGHGCLSGLLIADCRLLIELYAPSAVRRPPLASGEGRASKVPRVPRVPRVPTSTRESASTRYSWHFGTLALWHSWHFGTLGTRRRTAERRQPIAPHSITAPPPPSPTHRSAVPLRCSTPGLGHNPRPLGQSRRPGCRMSPERVASRRWG